MVNKTNGSGGTLPAYMQGVGEDTEFGHGLEGSFAPRVVFKGSRFRIRQGEDEIVIPDETMNVIILQDHPHVSRIYFGTVYGSEEGSRPQCASADGVVPLASVPHPQGAKCATCPQNAKGSSITGDGRKGRACQFFKRLVLLLPDMPDLGPVVTDIKSMSMFGDSYPGDDRWTLKAYSNRLQKNGRLPFHLITELSFDINESVPKVLFRPVSDVPEDLFVDSVTPLLATPDGRQLLEQLVDTSKVRFGDDEEAAPPPENVLAKPAPDYMTEPPPPAAEPAAALPPATDPAPAPRKKKATAKKKKAVAKEAAAKPEPETEAKAEVEVEAKTEPEKPATTVDDELESALADFGF